MTDLDDAVKAAERAVHDRWSAVIHNRRVAPVDERKSLTRIAVEAASPLIEKAVREQVAQEIETLISTVLDRRPGTHQGHTREAVIVAGLAALRDAAAIARGVAR